MPTKEILFPMRGVVRRDNLRATPNARGPWPAVWAANVRLEGNLDRRLRGGSRPGLTKFVGDDMGTTIADMASVTVSSAAGGSSEILLVLVDSAIKAVEAGATTTPVAYLTDEGGTRLTDEALNDITVSTGLAPASGFLVVGKQHVFAITTSGVTKIDPQAGRIDTLTASDGTIPTNCTFGAIYRDRLCLSGEDNNIYASRRGEYGDFDFGEYFEDDGRAYPFQLSLAAEVGALPTAMIPVRDEYMICGTARSLWVVRGDPTDGTLQRISEFVGIIGNRAWCRVDNSIVFLSEDGLYMLNGLEIRPMTPDAVPDELRDIDTSTTTVTLGWDQDRRAFHIYLRTAAGSDTHWLYEVEAQAFWPMRYQDDHSPLAVAQHAGELVLAGGDGYIRKVTGDDDDGSTIESHVAIGPLRVAGPNQFGRLLNMHASLAAGGGTVAWRVVTGDTAEEAADNAKLAIEAFQAGSGYDTYVKASGNWTSGRAVMSYPKVRAVWMCLWLQSTAKWGYEGVVMETVPSGKWRGS